MLRFGKRILCIAFVAVLCLTPASMSFAGSESNHAGNDTPNTHSDEGIPTKSEDTVPISDTSEKVVDTEPTHEVMQIEVPVGETPGQGEATTGNEPVQVEVPLESAPQKVIIPFEDAVDVLEIPHTSAGPIDLSIGTGDDVAPVIEVSLPTELPFVIDPYEIADRGQIYSEDFMVENRSNVDVEVSFQSFQYIFSNKRDFTSLEKPIEAEDNFIKKAIYMIVKTKTPELREILITDETQYESQPFVLSAWDEEQSADDHLTGSNEANAQISDVEEGHSFGSNVLVFGLEGNVNDDPQTPKWHDADVKIQVCFNITPLFPPQFEPETVTNAEINGSHLNDESSDHVMIIEEQIDTAQEQEMPIDLGENNDQPDTDLPPRSDPKTQLSESQDSSHDEQTNAGNPNKEQSNSDNPNKAQSSSDSPNKEQSSTDSPNKEQASSDSPNKEQASSDSPNKEQASSDS